MSEVVAEVEKPEKVNGAGKYKRKPRKSTPKPTGRKKPGSFKRSRALKRGGFEFQPFSREHMPYVYAAYKRGADLEPEPGMETREFAEWLYGRVMEIYQAGSEVWTILAETQEHGLIPVGLILLEYHGQIAYPHAVWFPEASPRNKLEVGLGFFVELKKTNRGFVFCRQEDESFFSHLCKYGVVRKVGRIREWYEGGKHATLYETVGH